MEAKVKNAQAMPAENFIEEAINQDIADGKVAAHIQTRFPPEPNGYLHIGHCKAMVADFATAEKYGGLCNLRFDDTNPVKEDPEFIQAIFDDIHWMGFEWAGVHYASEYFDQCYEFAEELIRKGKAYVDDLSMDEVREYRGTLTEPGKNSPYRDRTPEENLDLFRRMKAGEFSEGSRCLRAKIDMASPNINMRDPVIYRIRFATHHQTGDKWCIYPMYDYSHPLGDALEGVTHSLCSLEYDDHRPLYDWVVREVGFKYPPRQIEFSRLNMTGTIMSKRYLRKLVEGGYVNGWDDPRMPTIRGLRRRGYTPSSIREFLRRAGLARSVSTVDVSLLESCIRDELGETAPRAMAVLNPIKLEITNYPADQSQSFEIENHPNHPEMGTRTMSFSREIYIDSADFMENAPNKFFRLKPGGEVRLKGAFIIRCDEVVKNGDKIEKLLCTYDPDSYTGGPTADRKIKGTIHWVDAKTAVPCVIRMYDSLLMDQEGGGEHDDYMDRINFDSMTVYDHALAEASLAHPQAMSRYQFLRQGYFVTDPDTTDSLPVFNRIVGLKDTWAKVNKEQA